MFWIFRVTGVVSLLIRVLAVVVIVYFVLEQFAAGFEMLDSLSPYELVRVRA